MTLTDEQIRQFDEWYELHGDGASYHQCKLAYQFAISLQGEAVPVCKHCAKQESTKNLSEVLISESRRVVSDELMPDERAEYMKSLEGTFNCPVCGLDKPHYHDPKQAEILRYAKVHFMGVYFETVEISSPDKAFEFDLVTGKFKDDSVNKAWTIYLDAWTNSKLYSGTSHFTSPSLTTAQQSELIRKCAAIAPEKCESCSGRGQVYFGDPEIECPCPECEGSGEQPNKAILELLPEEGKG